MIIKQDLRLNIQKVESLLMKYGMKHLDLDIGGMQEDIKRLQRKEKSAEHWVTAENARRAADYLKGVIRKYRNGYNDLEWHIKSNRIKTYPIEIRRLHEFNLQVTDYYKVENQKVIFADFSELMDLLALELAHRDLGYSEAFIEARIGDLSPCREYYGMILTKRGLIYPYLYWRIMGLIINDTPYRFDETNEIFDYYGELLKADGTYRSMMESSANKTMALLTENVLEEADKQHIKVKVAGVYEDSMVLLSPVNGGAQMAEILSEEIVVRILGGYFSVIPKVEIY